MFHRIPTPVHSRYYNQHLSQYNHSHLRVMDVPPSHPCQRLVHQVADFLASIQGRWHLKLHRVTQHSHLEVHSYIPSRSRSQQVNHNIRRLPVVAQAYFSTIGLLRLIPTPTVRCPQRRPVRVRKRRQHSSQTKHHIYGRNTRTVPRSARELEPIKRHQHHSHHMVHRHFPRGHPGNEKIRLTTH